MMTDFVMAAEPPVTPFSRDPEFSPPPPAGHANLLADAPPVSAVCTFFVDHLFVFSLGVWVDPEMGRVFGVVLWSGGGVRA